MSSSTSSTCLPPIFSRKALVPSCVNLGSRASMQTKKASSENLAKRFDAKMGWFSLGRPMMARSANSVVNAEKRTVNSNITGNTVHTGDHKATSHSLISDLRLKKNIKPLENSLSKILKVQGVSYDWKDESMKDPQIGLIAQEIEKVYPEFVLFNKADPKKMRSVNYAAMVAPLIEAVKELYAMVMKLVSSDEKQNLEIEKLKAENLKLQVALVSQQESFEKRLKTLEQASAK